MRLSNMLGAMTLAFIVAGCATQAQRVAEQAAQISQKATADAEACDARIAAMPETQAVMRNAPGGLTSLQAQTNTAKATPAEVRDIFVLHNAIGECRKIRLEAAGQISPLLVAPMAERYAREDAAYAALVERKATWGEFFRAREIARVETKRQYDEAVVTLQRGLQQSHSAELGRRQQAAYAIQQWSYQQQVLSQQQQMINAATQPRTTNCRYIGSQLSCTTF